MKFRTAVLAAALLAGMPAAVPAQETKAMTALDVIHARKSVRHFTGEAVPRADLETLVRAGMAAPTAVNKQPWAFVIVTEKKRLEELRRGLPYARMLDRAGAAIVVCALPRRAFEGKTEFAVIDASLASENILLAAEALGWGAVWTSVYPDAVREALVRKTLGLPAEVVVLNVIPVGRPTGEDKPKVKYRAENVHWEGW